MNPKKKISRREFVTAAAAVATVSSFPTRNAIAAIARERVSGQPQTAVSLTDQPSWRDQGVENLAKSPHAKLRNIPVHAVTLEGGFWAARREVNVNQSIPTMRDLLEANGRMNNFLRLVGKSDASQHGPVYSDSDVYKWMEAVGFVLQSGARPKLRASA